MAYTNKVPTGIVIGRTGKAGQVHHLLKLPRILPARVGSETDGLLYEKLQPPGTQPDLTTAQNSLGSVRCLARWRAREGSGSSSTACESVPRMRKPSIELKQFYNH